MPGWLKALLIVAIVGVLLVIGAIGAGYIWWMRNRDSITTHAKERAVEGEEFGRNADNQGCIDETFLRYKKEPGFLNAINYGHFMEKCLEASRPTSGFCEAIPADKPMELLAWKEAQCQHYDVPNDHKCQQLVMPEVVFCDAKRRPRDEG